MIAKILQHQDIKTRFLEPKDVGLIATGTPNNAEVNPETYVNLKRVKINDDERVIFPGFYGITPSGHMPLFLVAVQILQVPSWLADLMQTYMKTLLMLMQSFQQIPIL